MSIALTNLIVFGASQIGTPGPANMVLMGTGARFGFRPALPFIAGVVLGKQLIIWPLGLGLLALANTQPMAFEVLKWVSIAYICWLAWKIANMRLNKPRGALGPGFWSGLLVHPLNPKAWGMVITSFANFVTPDADPLIATATLAICFLGLQCLLHPLWTFGGERIARTVAGTPNEKYLMWALAVLTVASVLLVLT